MLKFKNTYLFLLIIGLFMSCANAPSLDQTSNAYDQYKKDISYLASDELEGREIGTKGETLAANYIKDAFEKIGLEGAGDDGTFFQHFAVKQKSDPHAEEAAPDDPEIKGKNVLGFLNHNAKNTIIIGGHYDHLGYGEFSSLHRGERAIHNGADDNASGITAMIELAKRLKTSSTNNNYLFIAFSGEEKGLWGSKHYANNPDRDLKSINYMINMDMIGRMEENKILINGTGTAPDFDQIIDYSNIFELTVIKKASGMGPSDYTSFYLKDVPVLSFFTGQHEHYHKPGDDEAHINYEGIETVVDFIEKIIFNLNDKGKMAFTKTKDEQARSGGFKVTLGVIPDYMYDGKGMRIDGVSDGRTASKGGLENGDIVIKMGEHEVINMETYMDALNKFEPGASTEVVVKRGEDVLTKEITFE